MVRFTSRSRYVRVHHACCGLQSIQTSHRRSGDCGPCCSSVQTQTQMMTTCGVMTLHSTTLHPFLSHTPCRMRITSRFRLLATTRSDLDSDGPLPVGPNELEQGDVGVVARPGRPRLPPLPLTEPLYQLAAISLADAIRSLFDLQSRHRLTSACMEDLSNGCALLATVPQHTAHPPTRCWCAACATLFSTLYRRVPQRLLPVR